MPIVDHRTSLYDGQLEFADANIVGLITGGIRAATANAAVQKLATFFKNVIFEKLESQFTIIQNTDIVN